MTWPILFALCFLYYVIDNFRSRDPKRAAVFAVVLLGFAAQPASAVNVLDQVNFDRVVNHRLNILLPHPTLQAAANESSRRQAARRAMGHTGTMPMGTAEGVGYGRVSPNSFRFTTCFNQPGDYTTSHLYAGAAIVGGYATLSLDNNTSMGAVGSGKSSRSNRKGGLFRRLRGRR